MKNPSAIIIGDLHLRDSQPACRTDDFMKTQAKKLGWLADIQYEIFRNNDNTAIPILCPGDIFNHWKASPELITTAISSLSPIKSCGGLFSVFGNHDLPNHSLDFAYKSAFTTLMIADRLNLVDLALDFRPFCVSGLSWGAPYFAETNFDPDAKRVLITHQMVFEKKKPHWAGKNDLTAKEVLKKYPEFDLIISGHNHEMFCVEYKGRKLLNPGSFTRQEFTQRNFCPHVFLWKAETNEIEAVPIPIEKDVFIVPEKDEGGIEDIDVSFLENIEAVSLNFERNVSQAADNQTPAVRKKIYQALN